MPKWCSGARQGTLLHRWGQEHDPEWRMPEQGRPHAGVGLGLLAVACEGSPHVQSHGKYVCAMMCAYDVLVGRGAWAFEVRGRHVEACLVLVWGNGLSGTL